MNETELISTCLFSHEILDTGHHLDGTHLVLPACFLFCWNFSSGTRGRTSFAASSAASCSTASSAFASARPCSPPPFCSARCSSFIPAHTSQNKNDCKSKRKSSTATFTSRIRGKQRVREKKVCVSSLDSFGNGTLIWGAGDFRAGRHFRQVLADGGRPFRLRHRRRVAGRGPEHLRRVLVQGKGAQHGTFKNPVKPSKIHSTPRQGFLNQSTLSIAVPPSLKKKHFLLKRWWIVLSVAGVRTAAELRPRRFHGQLQRHGSTLRVLCPILQVQVYRFDLIS